MIKVYIIMSPHGTIDLNMFTLEGECYLDLKQAQKALYDKNVWSKARGKGIYELITLNVVERELNNLQ